MLLPAVNSAVPDQTTNAMLNSAANSDVPDPIFNAEVLRDTLDPLAAECNSQGQSCGDGQPLSPSAGCCSSAACRDRCTRQFAALKVALEQDRQQTAAHSRHCAQHSDALEGLWEVFAAIQERPPR